MKFTTSMLFLLIGILGTIAAETNKSYTFGLVAKSQSNPVFQAARTGAEQAAKDLGAKNALSIKIDWRTPNDEDAQKKAEAIEQLTLAGAGGNAGGGSGAKKIYA